MAIWDDLLTGIDREVYENMRVPGVYQHKGLGKKPAVIVVDVIYAWTGFKPEPILEAIKTYDTSCGEYGWAAIPHIQTLLDAARESGIPVFYSTIVDSPVQGAKWANRARDGRSLEWLSDEELAKRRLGTTIVKEIEPHPQDIVLYKRAASVFTGTPLVSHLNELDIDTLVVVGTSTSGCVHATVVDAACANYYVGIVEECCFDRLDISHKSSLLNMELKYGTVIPLEEAVGYMKTKAEPTLPPEKS